MKSRAFIFEKSMTTASNHQKLKRITSNLVQRGEISCLSTPSNKSCSSRFSEVPCCGDVIQSINRFSIFVQDCCKWNDEMKFNSEAVNTCERNYICDNATDKICFIKKDRISKEDLTSEKEQQEIYHENIKNKISKDSQFNVTGCENIDTLPSHKLKHCLEKSIVRKIIKALNLLKKINDDKDLVDVKESCLSKIKSEKKSNDITIMQKSTNDHFLDDCVLTNKSGESCELLKPSVKNTFVDTFLNTKLNGNSEENSRKMKGDENNLVTGLSGGKKTNNFECGDTCSVGVQFDGSMQCASINKLQADSLTCQEAILDSTLVNHSTCIEGTNDPEKRPSLSYNHKDNESENLAGEIKNQSSFSKQSVICTDIKKSYNSKNQTSNLVNVNSKNIFKLAPQVTENLTTKMINPNQNHELTSEHKNRLINNINDITSVEVSKSIDAPKTYSSKSKSTETPKQKCKAGEELFEKSKNIKTSISVLSETKSGTKCHKLPPLRESNAILKNETMQLSKNSTEVFKDLKQICKYCQEKLISSNYSSKISNNKETCLNITSKTQLHNFDTQLSERKYSGNKNNFCSKTNDIHSMENLLLTKQLSKDSLEYSYINSDTFSIKNLKERLLKDSLEYSDEFKQRGNYFHPELSFWQKCRLRGGLKCKIDTSKFVIKDNRTCPNSPDKTYSIPNKTCAKTIDSMVSIPPCLIQDRNNRLHDNNSVRKVAYTTPENKTTFCDSYDTEVNYFEPSVQRLFY